MLEGPQILDVPAVQVAVIHVRVPRTDIRATMIAGRKELYDTISEQGIAAASPFFTHHLVLDDAFFDFNLGVAVDPPVRASGRVEPGTLPGGTIARGVYLGPYEGLAQAWPEIDDWIAAQGRIPYDDLWEVYLTDPAHVPDPADYRTQLNRRLR